MVKLIKAGRVVMVTAGRFAGKKAIVVNSSETGTRERPFAHALVAGVEKGPRKVHKNMSKKKIERRCYIKGFIKTINHSHLMPTRYTVANEIDTKSLVIERTEEEENKKARRKHLQKVLKEKFLNPTSDKTGKVSKDVLFLRKKLRF